jgi:chemotaxis family two-component system response regulator Rcp1
MQIDILLVEDNKGDVQLLRAVLLETNSNVRLHVVGDGVEAMAFLKYQGHYLNSPRPDLILLDLLMPNMDGLEFLAQVKSDSRFKTIPIIVLAASRAESDISQSYQLMASCYLAKPKELEEFERLVKCLNDFWLTRVTFQKSGHTVETI